MNLLIFLLCAALSYATAPLSARFAAAVGAMDYPDNRRKLQLMPTPRLGGLSFFAAFAFFCILFVPKDYAGGVAVLCGGCFIVAAGMLDDTFSLSPRAKLLLQFVGAAIALAFTGVPTRFSLYELVTLDFPFPVAYLFALFRIVLMINAVNFSDGLDGLATGLSIVAFTFLALFAIHIGNRDGAILCLLLCAALLGFLPHNCYHARMYMGDAGSQFLGFAFGVLSLSMSGNVFASETSFFLLIPTADVYFSAARRILRGKSPFAADRGHLHHRLMSRGFTHPQAVYFLVMFAVFFAAAGLAINFYV